MSGTPEGVLACIADTMRGFVSPGHGEMIVVIPRESMGHIKEAGWTKKQVRQFLFDQAQRTAEEWARAGKAEPAIEPGKEKTMVPVCRNADAIIVIPAGGEAGHHTAIIPMWGAGVGSRSVTKEIDTSHSI